MSQFAISLQGSTRFRLSVVHVGAIDMDRGANMLVLRRDHDAVLSAAGREHEALLFRDVERGLSLARSLPDETQGNLCLARGEVASQATLEKRIDGDGEHLLSL